MLNLLPKDQKKKIIREYRTRFLIVAFSLLLAGEVIFLILLIPPYLTAKSRLYSLNSQSASIKAQNITTETDQLGAEVQKTSNYLDTFVSTTTPIGVAKAIKNIVDMRGSSVRISGLTYGVQNSNQQIVVRGTADTRQALLDFVNKLKAQPGVISADLPVSDFAQSKNIDFSVTFLAKPQNI